VRRVISGWGVREELRFRLCWLTELAHQKVVETWRERPEHAALAGKLLRPIAGDRLTIDFAPVAAASTVRTLEVRQSIQ
jgi:hypothetical protein